MCIAHEHDEHGTMLKVRCTVYDVICYDGQSVHEPCAMKPNSLTVDNCVTPLLLHSAQSSADGLKSQDSAVKSQPSVSTVSDTGRTV